jgi:tetratricopeptide (TPR) repeat protein
LIIFDIFVSKAIEINPCLSEALSNKGNALRSMNNYQEAINCYIESIAANPKFNMNKATELISRKSYKKSCECQHEKKGSRSKNIDIVYFYKGLKLHNIQKYEEAIEMFTKSCKINPKNVDALRFHGISLCNLLKYEAALEYFDKAIDLDPNNSSLFYNKGFAFHNLKKYTKAIQMFNRAIEINPNYHEAYCIKGLSLHSLYSYCEAIECFNRSIILSPKYADAYIFKVFLFLFRFNFLN